MWTMPVGRLDLGPLIALEHVLDDQRMEAEGLADLRGLVGRRARRDRPRPSSRACRTSSGSFAIAAVPSSSWSSSPLSATTRTVPGCPAGSGRALTLDADAERDVGSSRQRARPGSGESRPSASGPSRAGGSVMAGDGGSVASGGASALAARSSIRVRSPRRPPRVRLGGMATAVTSAATTNSPTMIDAASRDAQASSAPTTSGSRSGRSRSALGDELLVGVRRGVDLVVQAVDRRRAVGGQDRQPDGHPEHPRHGHDRRRGPEGAAAGGFHGRGRARGHGQPEPEAVQAERRARRSRGRLRRPASTSPGARRCSARARPGRPSRSGTTRTTKPEARAPTAVAPARAPSASRCSSGPPYSTRSTKTAPPMIAVANA